MATKSDQCAKCISSNLSPHHLEVILFVLLKQLVRVVLPCSGMDEIKSESPTTILSPFVINFFDAMKSFEQLKGSNQLSTVVSWTLWGSLRVLMITQFQNACGDHRVYQFIEC